MDKFYDESANLLQGKVTLDELIDQFMQNLRTWGLEVITQQLEQLDKDYKQLAIRKKRYAVKALRTCIKQTVYGQIAFKRTYYQDKSSGKYFYWLDEQLRLAKYSRMTLGFKAAVLINTGRHAYQEAIDMTKYNAIHSKATVMNIVHHEGKLIPNLVAEGKIKPRTNKVLYIEADEDHVAYQDSSNRFMKLVYVHEGYNTSAKRHFIKHAVYFTGNYLGSDNDLLWDEVWQYVKAMYPQVEKIYLAGDGAAWIKAGTAYFPHCKFVLDRFHLSKYCHLASTKAKQGTAEKLYAWALSGKQEKLKLYFSTKLSDPDLSKSARKQIKKAQTYILGNLEAIVRASEQDYQ
ncbi:UPF0236 family transposase-like protein [Lactobacillus sp. ESL0791]|uniref:UPF0236 family transposase-like protein n=1 Tax=Lactobacillus sp. ESL0791 TaxID=2983234 RepID=UPI0035AC0009